MCVCGCVCGCLQVLYTKLHRLIILCWLQLFDCEICKLIFKVDSLEYSIDKLHSTRGLNTDFRIHNKSIKVCIDQ